MLKTPTGHATEIFGAIGFDFVIVDQEHAPFDLRALDTLALAARAAGIASLVRVADAAPSRLLSVLDLGFTGVIVPHVVSASVAESVVKACRFANGHRGVSPSCRAGEYGGRSLAQHIEFGDRETVIVAMIEDLEAVENIDAILAVQGLDAILIGRADLAVVMGETSIIASRVVAAVEKIVTAARAATRRIIFQVNDVKDTVAFIQQGGSVFSVNTDQGLIRLAAQRIRDSFGRSDASAA